MPNRKDGEDRVQTPRDRILEISADRSRLLRGENPDTEYADDARHWIAVYEELLSFKREMLRTIDERVPNISEDARDEVLGTDMPLMQSEAARFLDRIAFWEWRLTELEPPPGRSGHD